MLALRGSGGLSIVAGWSLPRVSGGFATMLSICVLRYLVTPTFATLRRNGRSRRFDPIFTIENEPPRPREPPRHPSLLDASKMPQDGQLEANLVSKSLQFDPLMLKKTIKTDGFSMFLVKSFKLISKFLQAS